MKKRIYALVAIVILLAGVVSLRKTQRDYTEELMKQIPNISQFTIQTSEEQETPETTETTDKTLSVSDAQALLRSEWFGEHSMISYLPEMDRQEEETQLYCFSVDYSNMHMNEVFDNYGYAYAWVNSVTGEMKFEETEMYDNIPDSMFPIPMLNGTIVPYDQFWPHAIWFEGSYVYKGTITMESYQAQLREKGFVDLGSVMSIDSYWRYQRSDNGATLCVELNHEKETIVVRMYLTH